jgi:hypothetical protein
MHAEEQGMIIRYPKTNDPDRPEKDGKAEEPLVGAEKDDACRCKEASEMTPGELLKLMVSDLAFWKKMKTPKP